jgi:predicted DNA-binding transcriptional regulator YafY
LRNGITKACPNCGNIKPISEFEDKSLITGIGKVCFKCKAESKTRKERRKYEARKERRINDLGKKGRKNDAKIVAEKAPRIKKTDYNIILNGALNNHTSVKILYKGQLRKVDPYSLNNRYLVAYCHHAHDIRTFRVDRIQTVIVLSEGFSFDINLLTKAQSNLKNAANYNWRKDY